MSYEDYSDEWEETEGESKTFLDEPVTYGSLIGILIGVAIVAAIF